MTVMRFLWAAATAAALALTAAAATADVGYAPPGTDLIVRLNGDNIRRSKLFAPLRATRDFQRFEQSMHGTLHKAGMTFDDLLATDLFLFGSTAAADMEKLRFMLLARTRGAFAPKLLAMVDNAFDDEGGRDQLQKLSVGGREARLIRDEDDTTAVIAAEDDLLALLVNLAPTALPKRSAEPKLAAGMRPDALLCVAFENGRGIDPKLLELLPPVAVPLLEGAVAAKAELLDGDGRIVIAAEVEYATPERTQEAGGQFGVLILMGKMGLKKKHREWLRVLNRLELSADDRKVRLHFDCPVDDIARALRRR